MTKFQSQPLKTLYSLDGTLVLYPEEVVIKNQTGDVIINLSQILSIQVESGNLFRNGYIRLTSNESAKDTDDQRVIQKEKMVTFPRRYNNIVREIKEIVEGYLASNVYGYQWSALLDEITCNYCHSIDGKVISAIDKKFNEYQPGQVHTGCRCIWVAIMKDETNPPAITGIPEQLKSQYEVPHQNFKDLDAPLPGSSSLNIEERLYKPEEIGEQKALYGKNVFSKQSIRR